MSKKEETSAIIVKQICNSDYDVVLKAGFNLAAFIRNSINKKADEISKSPDKYESEINVKQVNRTSLSILKSAGHSTSSVVRQSFKTKADELRKKDKGSK